ncbi:MAG: PAS domain-containing protein, partial [Candidatus Neomarinimicrobiota bacterium]
MKSHGQIEAPPPPEDYRVLRLTQLPTIREYASTILENISDAIFLLDPSGKIKDANQTALKLLRVSKVNLTDKFIDELIIDPPAGHPLRNRPRLMQALRQGQFQDLEAILVYKLVQVPVYVSFSVVKNFDDTLNSIIVSAKDISGIKILEQKLFKQQLMAISQDRLRSLGELLVGLVHELGQPLSSLKLVTELTQSQVSGGRLDPDRLEQNLADIMEFIGRMSGTIHGIRSFAQRTQDEVHGLVDLKRCVTGALRLMSYDLDQRDIAVELTVAADLPKLWVNPVALDQVFVNLLTNTKDAFDARDGESPDSGRSAKLI